MGKIKIKKSDTLVVTGKGGVGKTTISAAIATQTSKRISTLLCDADRSPSCVDVFGFDHEKTLAMMDHPVVTNISSNLASVFISQIIPEIYEPDPERELLNKYLDAFLSDENSFLPLLRSVVQPLFYGYPINYEMFAQCLQLLEIFERGEYKEFNFAEMSVDNVVLGSSDLKIVDTENTASFIRMMFSLTELTNTIRNLHTAKYTLLGEAGLKFAISTAPNLKTMVKMAIIKYPDLYIDLINHFVDLILNKSKMIIVTRPGVTELNQLMQELKKLILMKLSPSSVHIVVNRYGEANRLCSNTANSFVNSIQAFINANGYSDAFIHKVDYEIPKLDITLSEETRVDLVAEHLNNIGKELIEVE